MPSKSLGIGLTFKANTQPVNYALRHLQASVSGANAGILQQSRAMEKNSKYMTKAMAGAFNQGAYAIEDFLTVVGTTGFGGGMRAAANNISMVARALAGPLVGGFIGAGVAGISLLPTLLSMNSALETMQDRAKKAISRLKELTDLQIKQKKDQYEYDKSIANMKTKQDANSLGSNIKTERDKLTIEREEQKKQLALINRRRSQYQRMLDAKYKNKSAFQLSYGTMWRQKGGKDKIYTDDERKALEAYNEEFRKLQTQIDRTGERLALLKQRQKQVSDLGMKLPSEKKSESGSGMDKGYQLPRALEKGSVEAVSAVNKAIANARNQFQNKQIALQQQQLTTLNNINAGVNAAVSAINASGINGIQVGQ